MTDQEPNDEIIDQVPGMGKRSDGAIELTQTPQPADPSKVLGHPANHMTGMNMTEVFPRNEKDAIDKLGGAALSREVEAASSEEDIITRIPNAEELRAQQQ